MFSGRALDGLLKVMFSVVFHTVYSIHNPYRMRYDIHTISI